MDRFLAGVDRNGTAKQLFEHYTMFGEDPWIASDDTGCKFSAWTYARERCRELATKSDVAE